MSISNRRSFLKGVTTTGSVGLIASAQYVHAEADEQICIFDNVEALKSAAPSVAKVGQFVETAGYYEGKVGVGAARYFIKAVTKAIGDGDIIDTDDIDGFGNHKLMGGNVAILQIRDEIDVK